MDGILISATLKDRGHVEILRKINGKSWRRAIDPHDEAGLDQYAPELSAEDKQVVLDKWAMIPVLQPEPPRPPKTDAEVDAEMDVWLGNPFMQSTLEALAELLPGSVTLDEVRDRIKDKGRMNIPR